MSKRVLFPIITIPEPCAENWDGMLYNREGAYCDKCAKSVVDFSQKSDSDIVQFFESNKGDNICGRFDDTQLHRILNSTSGKVYRNWALSALIVGFSVVPYNTSLSVDKGSLHKRENNEHCDNIEENKHVAVVRIIDEAGEKVVEAEVYIKSKNGESFLAHTNSGGMFGIVYSSAKECEIIVKKDGFVDYQGTLNLEKKTQSRVITLRGNYPENSSQYKFTCKVVDSTGKPITGATVSIPNLEKKLVTDERGRITFDKLPMRKYEVQVSVDDYHSERYTIPVNSQETELKYYYTKNTTDELLPKLGKVHYSDISMDNIVIIE